MIHFDIEPNPNTEKTYENPYIERIIQLENEVKQLKDEFKIEKSKKKTMVWFD